MKKAFITLVALLLASVSFAQDDDPIVMVVAGEAVPRSEFEYSYNKNNSEGVIDKKSIDEYVDLFINYKLKVKAAQDAQIDTLSSFIYEFSSYRDQQIRPAMIDDDDVEREAYRIYKRTQEKVDSAGGMVKPAHILIMVHRGTPEAIVAQAKAKIDSIYDVLKASGFSQEVFAELSDAYSQDRSTRNTGGELPWIRRGQAEENFDNLVFSMNVGDTSEPIQTSAGFHIIQLRDKGPFLPYDSLRASVMEFIDQRGVRQVLISNKLDSLAKAAGEGVTPDMILAQKREELEAVDPELRYLIKEYHDGLMLYEISNQKVWDYAEKDTLGLITFFDKNKKKYKWEEPHFKGIAYRTKDAEDIDKVKEAIRDIDFNDWNETLRSTFNNDSVLRIRVEKGVFKKGDNGIVDRYEYSDEEAEVKEVNGYPYTAAFGRMIDQPEYYTDVKGLVVADYQEELEKEWVSDLRKKYPVEVDKAVLATVNKH